MSSDPSSTPPARELTASQKFLGGKFSHNLARECIASLDQQITELQLENATLKSDLSQARTAAALARAAGKTATGEAAKPTAPSSTPGRQLTGLQKAIAAHKGQEVTHEPPAEPTGINRAIAAHKAECAARRGNH